MDRIHIEPIGIVHGGRSEPLDDDWGGVVSSVVLDASRFGPEALWGLDEFSHVDVVFHFDRVDESTIHLEARRPRENPEWPEVGIFAQRAKARPNRIGVTTCRVLEVDGLAVKVQGLDAVDGSPVIDLKPHVVEFGPRGETFQPPWMTELMGGYW